MSVTIADLLPLIPMAVVTLTGFALLLLEVFGSKDADRGFASILASLGLLAACYLSLKDLGTPAQELFVSQGKAASLLVDDFSRVASALLASGAIVACLISPAYIRNARCDSGEYYALILLSVVGMMVMAMSGDLITFFLGLETMSIGVYALTAMRGNDLRGSEAALKYFLMGAFATGFLLFGIAMIYGDLGSVELIDISLQLSSSPDMPSPLLGLGLTLLLIGFAFKVSAVPFHMWAPDVYEGAPTPITGFMAVGVKAAAFIGLLRLVIVGLDSEIADPIWIDLLTALAVITIIGGNVMALVQTNLKRMLAYSSISHAGYALIGVVVAALGEPSAGPAVLYYLSAYTFTTLGAFGVLTFLERKDAGIEAERYGAYAGVGFRYPALGAAMTLFMIALAGMPPTGGFLGKFYIFSAALQQEMTHLALIGIVGSVISVFYYLRVIVAFYMREIPEPGPTPTGTPSKQLTLGLILACAAVIILGIFPSAWLRITQAAANSLTGPELLQVTQQFLP